MVSDKASKCPKCGCPIEYSLRQSAIATPPPVPRGTATPPPTPPSLPNNNAEMPPSLPDNNPDEIKEGGHSKNVIIWVIVGVAVLLIAGGCVYFFLSRQNKTSSLPEADQEEVVAECDTVVVWEEEEVVVEDDSSISAPSGKINGYGYVDLGLSVKWATMNLGAVEKPQEYGGRYAWGEASVKSTYTKENSKAYRDSDLENISGNSDYDAARALWGGSWRMPTFAEMEELVSKCSWSWTGGGCKVTGPNGNSIYLPAAGYDQGNGVICKDSNGSYWSSSDAGAEYACWLRFDEYGREVVGVNRFMGCSIRPVAD